LPKEQSSNLNQTIKVVKRAIEESPFYLAEVLYPKYQFKNFHKQWFEQGLMDKDEVVLGPRGFAKTTIRAVVRAIYKLIKNPNTQLAIVSDTDRQAIKFMSETRMQLEQNKYLKLCYPNYP